MKDKLYNLEISKGSCSKSLFNYPCETVGDELLKGRKVYVYGETQRFQVLVDKIKSSGTIVTAVTEATDVIVLPNASRREASCIEGYYEELAYYQKVSFGFTTDAFAGVRNVIFLLPPHSTEFSTHYSQMADYAATSHIDGLSKYGARIGRFAYGVVLGESVDIDKLYDIILYLMSSNSNHIVCDVFKLDR